jgi:hypothetical protein
VKWGNCLLCMRRTGIVPIADKRTMLPGLSVIGVFVRGVRIHYWYLVCIGSDVLDARRQSP